MMTEEGKETGRQKMEKMADAWEDPELTAFMEWLGEQGFTDIRLFISARRSVFLAVQCQELKRHEYGHSRMYIVEAAWKGEYCCAYASSLTDGSRAEIVRRLKETAGVYINREIPQGIAESKDFRGQRWREINQEAVGESLMCAEREALSCEKAHFVEMCEYRQYEETVVLLDGQMHYLADDDGDCTVTVRVVAKDGDSVAVATKSGIADGGGWEAGSGDNSHDWHSRDRQEEFQEIVCELARRAAEDARLGLHAQRIASGRYPIVIENCVMAELTGHYLPMFYGENLMHHTSALAGKEHEQVGCDFLRLEEDPFSRKGTCRRRIDDEGTPVSKKALLRNGVFENVLYNSKSGDQAGGGSTGNGFKPDVTADIGTSATNMILSSEAGTCSREELLQSVREGIYITKIEGMFAGGSTESGDFSLLASGNRIVDGKLGGAVNQFTISGNICELWKDIEMIGDDPVYRMADRACVVSPSVKAAGLMVSGE